MKLILADVVLLVVGVMLFATAATALYTRGDLSTSTTTASATGIYNVAFTTSEQESGREPDDNMQSSDFRFPLSGRDVTVVTVVVTCTDNQAGAAQPFTLSFRVIGPNNLSAGPVQDECGGDPLEIEVPVSPVPQTSTAQGSTPEEARASLSSGPNATKAEGEWQILGTGSRGSVPAQIPIPPPSGEIRISMTQWSASLTPLAR